LEISDTRGKEHVVSADTERIDRAFVLVQRGQKHAFGTPIRWLGQWSNPVAAVQSNEKQKNTYKSEECAVTAYE
jgi:hypothetical protein